MPEVNAQDYAQAIKELLGSGEDQLIEQLGLRQSAINITPAAAGAPNLAPSYDGLMGPLDGVKALGRKILLHWAREVHSLACGTSEDDAADRNKLKDAFNLGDATIAGAITTLLVGSFGVAPAIATVIAVILAKRFIATGWVDVCAAIDSWIKEEEAK